MTQLEQNELILLVKIWKSVNSTGKGENLHSCIVLVSMYNRYNPFGEEFDHTYKSLNILHILLISNSISRSLS